MIMTLNLDSGMYMEDEAAELYHCEMTHFYYIHTAKLNQLKLDMGCEMLHFDWSVQQIECIDWLKFNLV